MISLLDICRPLWGIQITYYKICWCIMWEGFSNSNSLSLRCAAEKGEDDEDCKKYAKYYRSICPGDWVCTSLCSWPKHVLKPCHQFRGLWNMEYVVCFQGTMNVLLMSASVNSRSAITACASGNPVSLIVYQKHTEGSSWPGEVIYPH